MKKSIFLSVFFLASLSSMAQTQLGTAGKLLDKAYEKIKNYGGLALKFTYRWDYPQENTQGVKEGALYVLGEKYRLALMDIIQICDGNKIYTISTKDKEITVSNTRNGENILSPIQILATYRKNYIPTKAALKKVGKENIQFIRLDPKEKKSDEYLLVGINTTDYKLYQVVEMINNDTTTITIRKQAPWTNVDASLLRFDQKNYPNYMITTLD